MAAAGVILLIVGGVWGAEEKEAVAMEQTEIPQDVDAYAKMLEERIVEICSQVAGAGKTTVVVTLDGGYQAVYAVNTQSSASGYRSEFVLTGNGSSEKPLLIGYTVPRIGGIGIVCEGGKDPAVCNRILSLVSAAFGVSTNKIFVVESQNG